MLNEIIQLTAKTNKGKNKLASFGKEWRVMLVGEFKNTPALLLKSLDERNLRWVNITTDPDFEIIRNTQ